MSKKKDPAAGLFEETPKSESATEFAAMFERSLGRTEKALRVGDALRAEILSIGKEESFVSTGTAQDGIIFSADLLDENKNLKYKVGDVIDVVVMRVRPDEVRVTRKGSKSAPVELENLEDAFDMELPVEGKVTEVVNGGYRVSVQGQPAFCPISQMDQRPIADPSTVVGKRFEFLITQFDPKKRNIVVSRRKLLDLQRAENEGAWLEKHKPGDIVQGVVTRTEQFGAFVDLGGAEGLVHVSEIGYTRLKHASEGVSAGDPVQVKILNVVEEEKRLKISLSIKQAGGAGDPWMQVPQKFPVGALVEGTVDKKESFGIFVVLAPGINGLLPRSKWRDSEDAKKYENAKRGEPIRVRVDEVKFEERKISLGLPTEAEDDSWKQHQGASQGFGAMASAFSKLKIKKP
ncbi:MAG TPA: S1 RNA-binding domain-containing protein [Bdellovibrionales bacterium]|nr:S1 RNA-binding domain-containing protein [Bdellovibrionales bacterium]